MLERRPPVELVQEPPRLDERLLRQILETLRVALVPVQDGEHPRLMAPDDLAEIVHGAIAYPLKQFSIVCHHGWRRADVSASGSLRETLPKGLDRGVREVVHAFLELFDLRQLFRRQDGADPAIKLRPFNRQV